MRTFLNFSSALGISGNGLKDWLLVHQMEL
jgi:hypothetical protein